MRLITLTAFSAYDCDACGWEIEKGEQMIAIDHGEHYEINCLLCNEKREDALAIEGEPHDEVLPSHPDLG